jgi:hypothetical protein
MWKSHRTIRLVKELCACPHVGEVIIIDNDRNVSHPLPQSEKLRVLKMYRNIYVNPAWNLGVKEAKFENVALINDDVNFNPDVFKLLDDGTLKHLGVVGMAESNYMLTRDQDYQISSSGRHLGWGCVIMFAKERYVPIPEDLKIWCGDDWLAKHRATFQVSGLK